MSRPIAVLRPEPGNRVTASAIEAAGRRAIRLPLFGVRALAWTLPDPARFDALILTSANAIRHGGKGLELLRALPVYAVGEVTASAARRAGFHVAAVGDRGAADLIAFAREAGVTHALHLAGRDRSVEPGELVAEIVTVYASDPLVIAPEAAARLAGSVAILQSARAAARLAKVVDEAGLDRARIALVAIGEKAAVHAGGGWETVAVAANPRPETLVEAAIALAD